MNKNPFAVEGRDGYTIAFIRSWGYGTTRVVWVQDLCGRKLKSPNVPRPEVLFASADEAEAEIKRNVLNFIYENDSGIEFIRGWSEDESKANIRSLAIVLLTNPTGISMEAWNILRTMLINTAGSTSEANDDILVSVRETEGRYYLSETWNKL